MILVYGNKFLKKTEFIYSKNVSSVVSLSLNIYIKTIAKCVKNFNDFKK